MDVDFVDEPRTRFQVHSGPFSSPSPPDASQLDRKQVALCIILSLLMFGFSWGSQGWIQFLLLWMALALALGPFAPLSATGGDCRVGIGDIVPELKQEEEEEEVVERTYKKPQKREEVKLHKSSSASSKAEKIAGSEDGDGNSKFISRTEKIAGSEVDHIDDDGDDDDDNDDDGDDNDESDNNGNDGIADDDDMFDYPQKRKKKASAVDTSHSQAMEEAEWTTEDLDLLRKLVQKYPRGMLRRWEVIAEAFDGRHSVDSTVKMSKVLGEKKPGDDNAYSKFLAQRKKTAKEITSPLSQKWDAGGTATELTLQDGQGKIIKSEASLDKDVLHMKEEDKRKKDWTETEDKALLQALKTFPKDTPMRWEKVSIAVPGRTKPQCFKRYAELRENFRHNKGDKINRMPEAD